MRATPETKRLQASGRCGKCRTAVDHFHHADDGWSYCCECAPDKKKKEKRAEGEEG